MRGWWEGINVLRGLEARLPVPHAHPDRGVVRFYRRDSRQAEYLPTLILQL